ncbi:MAG: PadR family transcriptional regulator, partial [Deltaproteobacteria bacterium]|nr:PadR family transcriptional regulator [Deltaproteobacteria bacterium]
MKHVILGLLSESPCHGYALKKGISPALSRKQQVNDGILYPLLKNLEKSGLIKSKLKKEAKKPAKKIFSVTPKGKKYFLNWLRQDNDEEEVLYNFMLAEPFFKQCMFLEKLNPKARVTKLKDYLKKTQVKIKKLKTIYQG